ncbi:MAG: hypothetical protein JMDDDDMK_04928 [Acidobacteria bacterium]|nr:hypothetical protein [Acidobacteriota bacterium]
MVYRGGSGVVIRARVVEQPSFIIEGAKSVVGPVVKFAGAKSGNEFRADQKNSDQRLGQ